MQYHLNRLRSAQHLVLTAAISALAALGLTVGTTKPALAEFEIQESQVEKGEVELEYRGAVHWGFPKAEKEEAEEDDDEKKERSKRRRKASSSGRATTSNSLTASPSGFMFSTTLGTDEPLDGNFALSSVELELQYEIVERKGNGLGLAFTGGYGFATRGGEADEIEFGPIVELASGKFLLTLNPFFSAQVGEHRETDGLGFEYGWRAQYNFAKKWGVGAEMFGEIEDLVQCRIVRRPDPQPRPDAVLYAGRQRRRR